MQPLYFSNKSVSLWETTNKNLLYILDKRNYVISEEVRQILSSDKEFKTLEVMSKIIPVTIKYFSSANAAAGYVREMVVTSTSKPKHFILVVDDDNYSGDHVVQPTIKIETFTVSMLYVNPLTHYASPISIEKISADERKALPDLENGLRLMSILQHDPIVVYCDLHKGDVIRITDATFYSGQNASRVSYRQLY